MRKNGRNIRDGYAAEIQPRQVAIITYDLLQILKYFFVVARPSRWAPPPEGLRPTGPPPIIFIGLCVEPSRASVSNVGPSRECGGGAQ